MKSTKRNVSETAKAAGIGLSRAEDVVWLTNYIKTKPWAAWAKRQLREVKAELKQGAEPN